MATNRDAGLLLDTHIWLRYQSVSGALKPAALPTLHAAADKGKLFVSVISVWELGMLVKAGKVALHANVNVWVKEALSQPGINLLAFSPEIALETVYLPEPVHKDPADRILIASARIERLTLVTRDEKILDFATRHHVAHLVA